jgi:dihydrofolate reductase
MTLQCSVFIATSLDGFIARTDGSIDWLEAANKTVPPGEDCGYGQFMGSVDALVMGRRTFETVAKFPEWPYGNKPVWVVSRSLQHLPSDLPPQVELTCDAPAMLVSQARTRGWERLYIDGGELIQSFLRDRLLTDLTITTVPVLLGAGRRLFGELGCDLPMRLLSSRAYPFGFVQSVYAVADQA